MTFFRVIVIITLLLFAFAGNALTQKVAVPSWYDGIDNVLKSARPRWEIDLREKNFDGAAILISWGGVVERQGGSIQILWLGFGDIPNAVETFRGRKVMYSTNASPSTEMRELKDYGEEAVVWEDKATKDWNRLIFRRQKAIVTISGFTTPVIRELAAVIDNEVTKP